jgi:hypothetical protein
LIKVITPMIKVVIKVIKVITPMIASNPTR